VSNRRFGFTQEVQQARVAHSDQYTTFVRAKRMAAARKHLTQKEGGEDDVNMGMQPYRQARFVWGVAQPLGLECGLVIAHTRRLTASCKPALVP
jgi:hypothetical protein